MNTKEKYINDRKTAYITPFVEAAPIKTFLWGMSGIIEAPVILNKKGKSKLLD